MEALKTLCDVLHITIICPGRALGEGIVYQLISINAPLCINTVDKSMITPCNTYTPIPQQLRTPLCRHTDFCIPQHLCWVRPGTLENEDGKVKQLHSPALGLHKGEGAGRQSIWLHCFSNSLAGRLLSIPPSALLEESRSDKRPSRQAARNQKFN